MELSRRHIWDMEAVHHTLKILQKRHGTLVSTFIVLLFPSNYVMDGAQIANTFPFHSAAKVSFP
jgi:hypothetical protein